MPYARMLIPIAILVFGSFACSGQDSARPSVCDQPPSMRFESASKKLISRQMRPLFCAYRTLEMRLRNASHALIVERCVDAEQNGNRSAEKAVVRERIKATDNHMIEVGDLLQIPFQAGYRGGGYALVFAARDDKSKIGITEIQWISQPEAKYFIDLARLADDRSRVRFLLEAEAGEDRLVSDHAYAELEAIQEEQLPGLLQEDQRDSVLRRLQTPELGASRKSFYLRLLGYIGNRSDIEYLEPYVFPEKDVADFTGAATAAYLRLGDEQAHRKLVEHYFGQPPASVRTNSEKSAQAKQLYSVYCAIREAAPKLERRAKVGEYLIEYTVLGGLVLDDALRDSNTRFVEPAIESYHREGATAYSREESVVYLTGVLDCDLSADRRQRINRFLESVQATDPDLYRSSLERLEARRKFMTVSE